MAPGNLLPYLQQLRGSGFLNAIPDSDGVVRRVPLFVRYGDRLYPQIAVSALLDRLGVAAEGVRVVPGEMVVFEESPTSGQGGAPLYAVPIDRHGQMLVNWAGPWEETFTHLSCSDVYRLWQLRDNVDHNRQLPLEELEAAGLLEQLQADERRLEATERELARQVSGKICIIGLTAPGTHDYNPIPLESNYPLVGTHANVLNTILQQDYIHRIGRGVDAVILVVCVLFVALLLPRCSAVRGLVLSAVGMAGFTAAACALFSRWNVWIGMMSPWLGMSLTYVGTVTYRYMTEEREKRWIRSAFSRYISANVMEEVLSDPSRLRLGGERRELTVLFSDIRSFTTFSEQREPEAVVAMLNEYLDAMTKIVFKHNGTLDKYVGDEIMAVYGAPSAQPQTDHALRAVKTALEMMEVLHDLQVKWQGEGKPPLDIGIGLNTGVMVVGNMGSTERMDYTVIGDAVNLGARVEALTRQYNNHIIITEFTYEHVKEAVEVKELGSVTVKGKNRPVLIYELLGLKEGQPVVSA